MEGQRARVVFIMDALWVGVNIASSWGGGEAKKARVQDVHLRCAVRRTTSEEPSWLSFVIHALDSELIRSIHVLCQSSEEGWTG